MQKLQKFTVMFLSGCVVSAIVTCIAIALGMLKLIYWYLGNCGISTACTAASWTIDYWWGVFVPASLAAAVILRRVYDRRYARITTGE